MDATSLLTYESSSLSGMAGMVSASGATSRKTWLKEQPWTISRQLKPERQVVNRTESTGSLHIVFCRYACIQPAGAHSIL
jgi:hypothetical protein